MKYCIWLKLDIPNVSRMFRVILSSAKGNGFRLQGAHTNTTCVATDLVVHCSPAWGITAPSYLTVGLIRPRNNPILYRLFWIFIIFINNEGVGTWTYESPTALYSPSYSGCTCLCIIVVFVGMVLSLQLLHVHNFIFLFVCWVQVINSI